MSLQAETKLCIPAVSVQNKVQTMSFHHTQTTEMYSSGSEVIRNYVAMLLTKVKLEIRKTHVAYA